MITYLITGDIYLTRKNLKDLGAIYSYDLRGYIMNSKNKDIIKQIEDIGLKIQQIEYIEINEKYILQQKKNKAKQKAKRYNDKAEKQYRKSEESKISEHEREFLRLGEPVGNGHHSQGRHEKLLKKVKKDIEDRANAYKKAEEYNNKAKYWDNKKYYTKQEKTDNKQKGKIIMKEALKLWIEKYSIGDIFNSFVSSSEIVKINKTSVLTKDGLRMNITSSKDFTQYMEKAKLQLGN